MNTSKKHQTTGRLTAEQVAFYNKEGFIVYNDKVFSDAEFADLKNHFEDKLAAWPNDKRPEAMDVPHFTDPKLFRWLLSDAALDLVEPILGPDIALFSSHFICKTAGDGRRVPWHEDSAYWNTLIQPADIVTIWLAIDPSTRENGCMYVIPQTHNTGRKGYSEYEDVDTEQNVFHLEIVPGQRTEKKGVPCILEPNECSLHDARTMHGSAANTSNLRRCGYTMRYMKTSAKINPEFHGIHKIYLARGKALADNPYADPNALLSDIVDARSESKKKFH